MSRRKSTPQSTATLQLSLIDAPRAVARPESTWPSVNVVPHNEGGESVRSVLERDVSGSSAVLVVTGYAALQEVVRLLESVPTQTRVRLLFGTEPYATQSDDFQLGAPDISREVRDHWLERGFSVELSSALLAAIARLEAGQVVARIAGRKPMHAKIYVTDDAVTVGSSNFTRRGLGAQSEANARFESGEHCDATRELAEGLWQAGKEWTEGLIELLKSLLRIVSWQEVLARACAVVLDGAWAARYMPGPGDLAAPLWPHQREGLAQALHILLDLGSVLVADAAGSGKTRMGAWILRGLQDHLLRTSASPREPFPALFAPPGVVRNWERELPMANLNWRTFSHGPLSNTASTAHHDALQVLERASVLAVDEAHNFLNPSERTRRLRLHAADSVVLFTATPINRGPADLLALVELLGPDNFDDEALDRLVSVGRYRSGRHEGVPRQDLGDLKRQLRRFMVRRTRSQLNAVSERNSAAFDGRPARYPRHVAKHYDLPCSERDLDLLTQIDKETESLLGVICVGKTLQLSPFHKANGIDDEKFLRMRLASSAALARYTVMRCLRSSRLALLEHALGTEEALLRLSPGFSAASRKATGDQIGKLRAMAGTLPKWKLDAALREEAPNWLTDRTAHADACEAEAMRYVRIAELASCLSGEREAAKADHLADLYRRYGKVIAYDGSVLTLHLFDHLLHLRGVGAGLFTGGGGKGAKRRARTLLGKDATDTGVVALCTDALSEGLNLQGANCVVHLDTPTVIRVAEQRAGRVDRMDSEHDSVHVWWPREPEVLLPRRGEVIRERHDVVTDLIGANLELPGDDSAVQIESLVAEAEAIADADLDGLFDAFRPVREVSEQWIDPAVYRRMASSQADVVACVASIQSESAWAFFAVGGVERRAPRWVFVDDSEAGPFVDFETVADALKGRLDLDLEGREFDDAGSTVLERMIARVGRQEDLLITPRRRRALELAKDVFKAWAESAWSSGDRERTRYLRAWLDALKLDGTESRPDPREFADAWLRLIRPHRRAMLIELGRGKRPLTLDRLAPRLRDDPMATETLRETFRDVPVLAPIGRRVVAAIVGVPS